MNLEYLLSTLSKSQKTELLQLLSVDDMNELSRFENGRYCPHCKNHKPIKKGIIRNRQRFYCSSCKKYFTVYAQTILNYTKKEISTWKHYIKFMFEARPKPIKEISKSIGISERTAFRWRHKILNVLNQKFMNDNLGGIVEADETFILTSRKGVHIEGIKGRRSGGVSKYRGISREQAGILVAIDRNKNLVSKVYGYGKISGADVVPVLQKRIDKNSLLITDGCSAYLEFAKYENIEIRQLKGGKPVGGVHMNTVNSYHSKFKQWMYGFNGVSTKYLNNYLAWFKFVKQKNDCGYLFNQLILG